jgi:hypothetical protein
MTELLQMHGGRLISVIGGFLFLFFYLDIRGVLRLFILYRRYNRETLSIRCKRKTIDEVLAMTV